MVAAAAIDGDWAECWVMWIGDQVFVFRITMMPYAIARETAIEPLNGIYLTGSMQIEPFTSTMAIMHPQKYLAGLMDGRRKIRHRRKKRSAIAMYAANLMPSTMYWPLK